MLTFRNLLIPQNRQCTYPTSNTILTLSHGCMTYGFGPNTTPPPPSLPSHVGYSWRPCKGPAAASGASTNPADTMPATLRGAAWWAECRRASEVGQARAAAAGHGTCGKTGPKTGPASAVAAAYGSEWASRPPQRRIKPASRWAQPPKRSETRPAAPPLPWNPQVQDVRLRICNNTKRKVLLVWSLG